MLFFGCCCLQELESQLVAASEEKTKVQSKYHELSIKHRQLIETSPQVATIWNEVLVQQAQAHGDAAAEQRLRNFDLRHTGANSGLSMSVGQGKGPAAAAAAAVWHTTAAPRMGSEATTPDRTSCTQPCPMGCRASAQPHRAAAEHTPDHVG